MAGRCGCATDRCDCVIVAGNWVSIYGSGTKSNPYVIEGTQPIIETGGGPGGASRLVGEIIAYGGPTAPPGWLLCDGQAVSRAIYAALYAVLGTAYGAGDGVNTFNVPNYQGRFVKGASPAEPRGTVREPGMTRTLTTAHLPAHVHGINHDHPAFWSGGSSYGNYNVGTAGEGNHQHNLTKSNSVGEHGGTLRMGAGNVTAVGVGGIDVQGWHGHIVTLIDHTHHIDIPNFGGWSSSTGASPTAAIDIQPNYITEHRMIYTGVGVE
jgi:microcystin-dependent protein